MSEALIGDRNPTVLNRGISISDLLGVAQKNNQEIRIIVTPSGINVNVAELKDGE